MSDKTDGNGKEAMERYYLSATDPENDPPYFTSPPHILPNIVAGERSAISDILRSSYSLGAS